MRTLKAITFATALFVLAASNAYGLTIKKTVALDIFFGVQKSVLTDGDDKLESFACKASNGSLEVVVAVGHADVAERQAQSLSEARAQFVKSTLVNLGVPAARIYAEGKGDSQPVVKGEKPTMRIQNRRVELEMILTGWRDSQADCLPLWVKHMLMLPVQQALIVAKNAVVEGRTNSAGPALRALEASRLDLVDAFLDKPGGISRSADSSRELAEALVRSRNPRFIRYLQRIPFKVSELQSPGNPFVWLLCSRDLESIPERDLIEAVQQLLVWGAKPVLDDAVSFKQSGLGCAAFQGKAGVVDALLAAGANPNLPEGRPVLLQAGRYPSIVRRLLLAGANPQVKLEDGSTLFHQLRFESGSDVLWLSQLGLNPLAVDSNGATPFGNALAFASPDVLDAFLKAGVDLGAGDAVQRWVQSARPNLPALVWLIDHGIPMDRVPFLLSEVVGRGDANLPALEALVRRKIDVDQRSEKGVPVLFVAIASFAPKTVQLLVELMGKAKALSQTYSLKTAISFAASLDVRLRNLRGCADCDMAAYQAKLEAQYNNPEALKLRQAQKDEIISILQNAERGD